MLADEEMNNQQTVHTDCRSEVGVTIGLIDSLIFICRILSKRDLQDFSIGQALSDFISDEDVNKVIGVATKIYTKPFKKGSCLDKEKNIVLMLGEVWNKYLELPEENDLEKKEFCSLIHRCQDTVAARQLYRMMREEKS